MTKFSNIARPYAKALFAYAKEQGQLSDWSQLLSEWAAIAEHPEGKAYLNNPTVSAASKVDFLKQRAPSLLLVAASRFLELLVLHRRFNILIGVADLFERQKRQALNQLLVRVVSSAPLSKKAEKPLEESLTKRFGKTILLEKQVDPSLLGGMLVMTEDIFIDGSIKGRLEQLANNLKRRVG